MYELIGYQTNYTPNSYTGTSDAYQEEDVVATFDTKKQAEDYVKASRLKNPKRSSWDDGRPFKKRSLLGPYAFTEIHEKIVEEPPPHNPDPYYLIYGKGC